MAYSKTKPYNRTSYKGAVDPSYDRYLKEAVAAGRAENIKESELEKPYNVKQTYSAMQQEYQPVTPPVIDPGPGTGGLRCIWTSTGCEQLVGCWAGSDIVLDGPEAATAGYMSIEVLTGEIVSQTVSGSESRGISIVMSPIPRSNLFNVRFKDGLGVIHTQLINITCVTDLVVTWHTEAIDHEVRNSVVATDGKVHGIGYYPSHYYSVWDGASWTYEAAPTVATQTYSDIVLDGSDIPTIVYKNGANIQVSTRTGGSWSAGDTAYSLVSSGDQVSNIVLLRDTSGYLHIFIGVNPSSGDDYVRYITNTSGSWLSENIITFAAGSGEQIGSINATAYSSVFYVAVTGYYSGTDYLKNVYGTYGSWTVENSDSYSSSGSSSSIPVILTDSGGNLNIISTGYRDNPAGYLRHGRKVGSWSTGNIATTPLYFNTVAKLANNIIHCFSFNQYGFPAPTYRIDYFQYSNGSWTRSVSPLVADNSLECCVYDSTNNILHAFYSDSSFGYLHAYAYL